MCEQSSGRVGAQMDQRKVVRLLGGTKDPLEVHETSQQGYVYSDMFSYTGERTERGQHCVQPVLWFCHKTDEGT